MLPSLPRAAIWRSASSVSVAGCSPALPRGGVPRALLGAPLPVTDPDQHDVAPAHANVLVLFGREQVRLGHDVPWL